MSDTIQAAERSAAFVLRDLNSSDVWQMVRILRKFKLTEIYKQIDQDLIKASKFEAPLERAEDGSLVPLSPDKWTEAQKKACERAKKANEQLTWIFIDILIDNIGACETEVNTLLAMGIGRDRQFVAAMPPDQYLDLIVQYVTREGFSDFFTHARSLLGKVGSQNFTGHALNLVK